MLPILVIAVILIPGNLTHFYCCDWVDRWKLFLKILECLSVSESLRCYAGKGGGKFQDCHPDFGYKTCFSKFENGKAMTNILMNSKKYFLEKTFWFLFHCLTGERVARGCSTKRPMLYVECEAHKRWGVQSCFISCVVLCEECEDNPDHWQCHHPQQARAGGVLLLQLRPLQQRGSEPRPRPQGVESGRPGAGAPLGPGSRHKDNVVVVITSTRKLMILLCLVTIW